MGKDNKAMLLKNFCGDMKKIASCEICTTPRNVAHEKPATLVIIIKKGIVMVPVQTCYDCAEQLDKVRDAEQVNYRLTKY